MRPGAEPVHLERLIAAVLLQIEARTGWMRRQTRIAVGAAFLITIICCLSSTMALVQGSITVPTPTYAPLPPFSAKDTLDALRAAGVSITALTPAPVPSAEWPAREAFRFEVSRGSDKGLFALIGFASASEVGPAVLTLPEKADYRRWEVRQVSNLLLLTGPGTPPALVEAVNAALTAYAVAPYRPFLRK